MQSNTHPITTTSGPFSGLHQLARTGDIISQSKVVDLLLDLYSAVEEPAVRDEIGSALALLSRRNLVTATELRAALAVIETAAQVEAAFAHLLLVS